MKKVFISLSIILGILAVSGGLNAENVQYPTKKQMAPINKMMDDKAQRAKNVVDYKEAIKSQPPIVSLYVSPISPNIKIGETVQFKASAVYPDKSTKDITTQVVWNSSDPGVAAIGTNDGLAKGVKDGTTMITASFSGKTSQPRGLKVVDYVSSIEISQSYPYKDTIIVGESTEVAVQILWGSGKKQTPVPAKPYLHSSDESVVSLEVLTGNNTIAKGSKEGAAEIYAECEGAKSPPLKLTVTNNAPLPEGWKIFDVKADNIFIAGNGYVWKTKLNGDKWEVIKTFGGSGPSDKEFGLVDFYDIIVDDQQNIYTSYDGSKGISYISSNGKIFFKFGSGTHYSSLASDNYNNLYAFWTPTTMHIYNGGNLIEKLELGASGFDMAYIGPTGGFYMLGDSAVHKLDKQGKLLESFPVNNAASLEVDALGNFYVSFIKGVPDKLKKFSPAGELLKEWEVDENKGSIYSFKVADDYKIYISTGYSLSPILIIEQ